MHDNNDINEGQFDINKFREDRQKAIEQCGDLTNLVSFESHGKEYHVNPDVIGCPSNVTTTSNDDINKINEIKQPKSSKFMDQLIDQSNNKIGSSNSIGSI